MAYSLRNLAIMHRDQGDLKMAESLLREALAIREKARDTDHAFTRKTREDLADVLRRAGRKAEAEELLRRSVASKATDKETAPP